MKKIILIGGSPTAGKSYTTRKIGEELKLPWISTDIIRDLMRNTVRKEDYPDLFYFNETTPQMAVEFLNKYTPKEIIEMVDKESTDVWKGVKAIIDTDYVWGSYIVEGVAIIPHVIFKYVKNKKNIKVLFLIDEDIERIRKTIFTRGLWDDAKKYSDSVKEKEVEWVVAFNEYIKKEAKKYGFPVVSIGNRMDYVEDIKRIIGK